MHHPNPQSPRIRRGDNYEIPLGDMEMRNRGTRGHEDGSNETNSYEALNDTTESMSEVDTDEDEVLRVSYLNKKEAKKIRGSALTRFCYNNRKIVLGISVIVLIIITIYCKH